MRYASTDDTGHVTFHATLPQGAVRLSDGAVFRIHTLRRKADKTLLIGGNEKENLRLELDGFVDVSDLAADGISGWMLIFPTFEEIKAKWHKGNKVVSHRVIKRDEIIKDRTFRKAWRDNGKIGVDMPVAREMQRERIRLARAALLETLDIEYQRADERGEANRKRDITAEKQRLRDFTKDPRIDAAKTPDELKTILPDLGNFS